MKTCPVCNKEMKKEIISNIACKQTSHSYEEYHLFKLYKIKEYTFKIYKNIMCLTTYLQSGGCSFEWYQIPNFKLNPSHVSVEAIKSTINKLLIFS